VVGQTPGPGPRRPWPSDPCSLDRRARPDQRRPDLLDDHHRGRRAGRTGPGQDLATDRRGAHVGETRNRLGHKRGPKHAGANGRFFSRWLGRLDDRRAGLAALHQPWGQMGFRFGGLSNRRAQKHHRGQTRNRPAGRSLCEHRSSHCAEEAGHPPQCRPGSRFHGRRFGWNAVHP